jgi:hypothetical protein
MKIGDLLSDNQIIVPSVEQVDFIFMNIQFSIYKTSYSKQFSCT